MRIDTHTFLACRDTIENINIIAAGGALIAAEFTVLDGQLNIAVCRDRAAICCLIAGKYAVLNRELHDSRFLGDRLCVEVVGIDRAAASSLTFCTDCTYIVSNEGASTYGHIGHTTMVIQAERTTAIGCRTARRATIFESHVIKDNLSVFQEKCAADLVSIAAAVNDQIFNRCSTCTVTRVDQEAEGAFRGRRNCMTVTIQGKIFSGLTLHRQGGTGHTIYHRGLRACIGDILRQSDDITSLCILDSLLQCLPAVYLMHVLFNFILVVIIMRSARAMATAS